MSANLSEILQKVGWTDGFHVPIANAENQKLEADLERLTLRKSKAKSSYESACSRYEAIDKHLKYVKQETEQNQKLLTAYKQQLDSENHKLKISIAENERVNQEMRQMNKTIEEVEKRQEVKRSDLATNLNKIDKMKAETTWDTEALNEWEESLKKRDEDNELLKKFSKEDAHKANELEAKRQSLQVEVVNKRDTVSKMMAEITNYEQVIERIGKIFKQQAIERTALVAQWQDSVKHLRQRDEDIARTNRDIYFTEEVILQQQEILDEQNNFFNNEINNNKAVGEEIQELNLKHSRMRKELNELIQYVLTLTSEVNTLKRTMTSSSQRLEKDRMRRKNLEKELQQMELKIAKIMVDNEELVVKVDEVKNSSMTASERAKHLEQMIDYEQGQTNIVLLDTEKIQGILYRSQLSYQELKEVAKMTETEISGCEVSLKSIEKQCKVKLNELHRQQEVVYNLDYRVNEMEVHLTQIEGITKEDEETEILNAKIADLERILAEHTEVKNFLQAQVNRLEDEMRRLGIAIAADRACIDSLRGKLQDQILLFEGGVKQAAAAKLKSQQRQVEENILRLRVSQLNKALSKEDKNIYDLQKFRLELETAMRERQIEINAHKDILLAHRKNLDEARGRLRADIKARDIRIEQFQKKHHIALMMLGKDDDGQPLSITHFKIKNAQEKYMLQQEGDELDNKIKRSEKEIIAMENTLKIVNMTNVTYKKSLSSINDESDEIKEMKQLEHDIVNTAVILRRNKKILADKQKCVKELEKVVEDLLQKQEDVEDNIMKVRDEYTKLMREDEIRQERMNRTDRHLNTLKRNISHVCFLKPERNIEIRQLQDSNKSALQQLADVSTNYAEISPVIKNYLSEYNIELQGSRSRSLSLSSLSSTRSSVSSTSTSSAVSQIVLTFDNVQNGKNNIKK